MRVRSRFASTRVCCSCLLRGAALAQKRRPLAHAALAHAALHTHPSTHTHLHTRSYASLQIPSQILAVHIGGHHMLGLLAFGWGIVSIGVIFVKSEVCVPIQSFLHLPFFVCELCWSIGASCV